MKLPIRQIAYFVPDVRAAAARHVAAFGSGPYFVADHIPLRVCRHRGREAELDHALEPAQAAMEAAGYEAALWAEMNDGFHDLVKEAAREFDGTDLIRTISPD